MIDGDKRKEEIRTDANKKHQLFGNSLTRTLKSLLQLSLVIIGFVFFTSCSDPIQTDVFIAGGGTSGVAAGIQAARMGATAVLAAENEWLGGMLTGAGVSAVDGNYNLPGGIWGEFKNALENNYGGDSLLKTGWVSNVMFEPSVGNRIFSAMAAAEPKLTVLRYAGVSRVKRSGDTWIISVTTTGGTLKYSAAVLIDATELGDVAAMCGVKYDIGMDSRFDTGEDIAPEKANNIIQDLTYVAVLKDYGREVPMIQPEGYDPSLFACSCINPLCSGPDTAMARWSCELMLDYGKLPNNKYMLNWPISGNDYYVNLIEMEPGERAEALKAAKQKTLGFLWFIRNELGYWNLALADDEFPTADSLPFMPYHRESRRIHGKVRFTLNHIKEPYIHTDNLYRTCIAVGDYPVDHHHSAYTGSESLPDLSFYPVPSFGLPLGTLIPEEVEGLIVAEKSISVTNLVNGATRLQPVVLQIGQASGALAALAAREGTKISEVPVRDVQNALLDAGGYLLPYLDQKPDHALFKILQRIGSTGIMKGTGVSQGWSNRTFFRANEITLASDLEGLKEIYPLTEYDFSDKVLTVQQMVELIRLAARQNSLVLSNTGLSEALDQIFRSGTRGTDRPVLRGEAALLIDRALDPFNKHPVNLKGEFIKP
ncbi:MAG: FAD-dependent oxidoreductase [Bacteroidales bacterium]|nr:FAD-dependent oxidoreductase [Bacteroidales bacterium]